MARHICRKSGPYLDGPDFRQYGSDFQQWHSAWHRGCDYSDLSRGTELIESGGPPLAASAMPPFPSDRGLSNGWGKNFDLYIEHYAAWWNGQSVRVDRVEFFFKKHVFWFLSTLPARHRTHHLLPFPFTFSTIEQKYNGLSLKWAGLWRKLVGNEPICRSRFGVH